MFNFFDFYPMNLYRSNYFRRNTLPVDAAYVRIFHASPDAPPVDVYVNNSPVVSNLRYRSFTEYLPLAPGVYNVKIYPAGTTRNPVLNTNINVPANTILTVAAINKLEDIALYAIEDTPMPVPFDKVYLRFVHLSPNAPSVDVRLPDGKNVFQDVEYKEITDYKLIEPGTYTLDVYGAGTNKRVLHVPNITLKPNRFYTVYAIGLLGDRPPLQVVIPLDGNSYIKV